MSRKRILHVTAIFLLSSAYAISYSQTKSDTLDLLSLSLEELLNVNVTVASNVVEEFKKQPVSVTSISNEQLELSGARTLLDAIMLYVPGVFAVEDQDDVIIGFRGLAADNNSKVLLLINGVNLNTEFFWGPPSAILNSTNYDYIERVEVIRGPGSVTLGQGALLGVINIVTKNHNNLSQGNIRAEVTGHYGLDNFAGTNAYVAFQRGELRSYISTGMHKYDGQDIREEGWAKDKFNEGYRAGNVANIGTKLKRSENTHVVAGLAYMGLDFQMMYFNQSRDLYNFYRDRNRTEQSLFGSSLGYTVQFNEQASLSLSGNYTLDNIALKSVDGFNMGGTMERRYGGKMVYKNTFFNTNNVAIGAEFKSFDMGNENRNGANFIRNSVDTTFFDLDFIDVSNTDNTWIFNDQINLLSLFFEDYIEITDKVAVFTALRYDNHSFWGSNISPRLGSIFNVSDKLYFKLTYQEGFRGAVGAQYSGGFKGDGFLRLDNFDEVSAANIPVYDDLGNQTGVEQNLSTPEPEKIKSGELTMNWNIGERINFNMVTFYNSIQNVIDVGVIAADASQFTLPNIGTDSPGDWNGYWFFKNTEGSINEFGIEGGVVIKTKYFLLNCNHSFVKVVSSHNQQRGSMYLNNQDNFKAYPQNVTRVNILTSLNRKLSVGINYLYYYSWYSPTNQKVDGNHLLNASIKYSISKAISASFHSLNLLNQSNLYPMTNNVNNPTLSDGTPSLESTSFWLKLTITY